MIPQEIASHIDDVPSDVLGHPLLDAVFEGIDFGLAVFDADLKLLKVNDLYLDLCGYQKADTPPGTPLQDLMALSLKRRKMDEAEISTAIATTLLRLKVGGEQRFSFQTAGGRHALITRIHDSTGQLIETVREISGLDDAADTNHRMRHLAETARSRMMHALDAMADGFALFDSDDQLISYNQKYIEMNCQVQDLIKPGACYENMLREGVVRGAFHTSGMDNETYIHWRLQQHFNPAEPHEHQTADGRWIRTLERPTDDGGIVGIHSDITELKKREEEMAKISGALDRTNDHFNEALNNMIQGLCMFDADQRLILCNRQYLELYGFSEEVVRPGILISDIMRYSISLGNYRDEDAQAALNARHDPDRLKKRTTIKQYLRDERVIAVMNEPMANGGTIATYQDITAMEQHEVQLLAHTKKLEISNRELQEFAYVASHDLQEPLRKIETFSDRLMGKFGDHLPEDGRMYVDRMQNAACRMRQLINDLLSYSRVTTNANPYEFVDISEVIEGVLSDLQMRIQDSNGTVEIADMPKIEADPMQMRQLFQNLISNALKFKKPDLDSHVSIKAEKFLKQSSFGASCVYWRFLLSDNGIGFEPTSISMTGLDEHGLGLLGMQERIAQCRGNIEIQSRIGYGTRITVHVPLKENGCV